MYVALSYVYSTHKAKHRAERGDTSQVLMWGAHLDQSDFSLSGSR